MKLHFATLLFVCLLTVTTNVLAQPSFNVVPLGVKGGSDESNLSAYALAATGTNAYICLDAGTLNFGINKAINAGSLQGNASDFIKNNIKGYLISHAHLDHVSGLMINSPDDSPKVIYGTPFCIDILKDKYFTWKNWANFTNEGDKPTLNKYHYMTMLPNEEIALEQTTLHARAFTLSHSAPYQSTAFLVRNNKDYIVYLGDTGADEIEKASTLETLWNTIAPLIQSRELKALFIEVSFSNAQPDKFLFGHLTPKLFMNEMAILNSLSNHKLNTLPIVITHRKPGGNREAEIKTQLEESNSMNLKLIFPEQGEALQF